MVYSVPLNCNVSMHTFPGNVNMARVERTGGACPTVFTCQNHQLLTKPVNRTDPHHVHIIGRISSAARPKKKDRKDQFLIYLSPYLISLFDKHCVDRAWHPRVP